MSQRVPSPAVPLHDMRSLGLVLPLVSCSLLLPCAALLTIQFFAGLEP